VVGIDPEKERLVGQLEKDLIRGKLNALHSVSNGIILGEGVADKLGAKMGNIISVISPAGIILRMKVVGIFQTGITAIDNFDSYALLKKAQILQNRPNVINQIRIRLEDVDTAGKIARQIEAQYRYRTESWKETYQNVLGIFVIQNSIMYSTVGAILIVAGFGIFNIISTIIHEKARDIAILKSIGLTEGDIRLTFLLEGVIVGLVGTLSGWVLGRLIVIGLGSIQFEIEGFVKTEGFILYETYLQYMIAGGFALLASSLAAFLPARKAAQLNPVDIIRGGV
jgi:lipoprotein-releasing system permease protein